MLLIRLIQMLFRPLTSMNSRPQRASSDEGSWLSGPQRGSQVCICGASLVPDGVNPLTMILPGNPPQWAQARGKGRRTCQNLEWRSKGDLCMRSDFFLHVRGFCQIGTRPQGLYTPCSFSSTFNIVFRIFLQPLDYTVHGILQARILEWVAFPFSRGSFQPRDRTQFSHTAGRFFTS